MEPLTLDKVLLESCYNPYHEPGFDWSKWDGSKTEWNVYTIETHCLLYRVIARLNPDGQTYEIKSYSVEDC